MKRISKDSVEDITNHILHLFEQRLGSIESKSRNQQDTIRNMKGECTDIEKTLASLGISEEKQDFQVCESLAVELKTYLRSKPAEGYESNTKNGVYGQEEEHKGSVLDQLTDEDQEAKKEEEVNGKEASGSKVSPNKVQGKHQSKLSQTPEKKSLASPKTGVTGLRNSVTKKF